MSPFNSLIKHAQKDAIDRFNVAAIIINKDSEVLYCQRSLFKKVAPGAWHIPGGRIEKGESIEDAIKRELQEELGLQTIRVHSFSGINHDYTVSNEKHRTAFFLVEAKGEIVLNPENTSYAFLAIESVKEYLEPENITHNKKAFEYALKHSILSDVS